MRAAAAVLRPGRESPQHHAAIRTLSSLGHVQPFYSENTVETAPPVLARLPHRGLPTFVMSGFRTPGFVMRLREAARRHKCRLRIDAQPREWAPVRLTLEAGAREDAEGLAEDLGAFAPRDPPAASLADAAIAIDLYETSLIWEQGPDLAWPVGDFDPATLRFMSARSVEPFKLSAYQDPVSGQIRHRLWDGARFAACDRALGRYAILRRTRPDVLHYDPDSWTLAVPAGCPLPPVLARAAALCTGLAPTIISLPDAARVGGPAHPMEAHQRVPPSIAQAIASRLGQTLQMTRLTVAGRYHA